MAVINPRILLKNSIVIQHFVFLEWYIKKEKSQSSNMMANKWTTTSDFIFDAIWSTNTFGIVALKATFAALPEVLSNGKKSIERRYI